MARRPPHRDGQDCAAADGGHGQMQGGFISAERGGGGTGRTGVSAPPPARLVVDRPAGLAPVCPQRPIK
jgi:hypothetical protein